LVVIVDRDTGRSTGFGFVEMDGGEQAEAAMDALNGQEVMPGVRSAIRQRPTLLVIPR
jgi:RNA recognition motif-containing protein